MPGYKLSTEDGVVRIDDNKFIPANASNPEWKEYRSWIIAGNIPLAADEELVKRGDWDKFRDGIMQNPGYNRVRISMLNTPAELYGSRMEAAASRAAKDVHLPTIIGLWNLMMTTASAGGIGLTASEISGLGELAESSEMPLTFNPQGNIVLS